MAAFGWDSPHWQKQSNGTWTLLQRALTTGEPCQFSLTEHNLPAASPLAEMMNQRGGGHCLLAPLPHSHRLAGALLVVRGGAEKFEHEDISALMRLSSLAALAMKNAQLYAQEQETGAHLRQAVEQIRTHRDHLTRLIEVNTILTRTVLAGAGVQGICRRLHELVGNPVIVNDQFSRVLH